jgi:hypothetical protein
VARTPADEPGLPEKILAIHAQLDDARVAHAFGGALALAYYAEPRATIDIDVNLFAAPTEYEAVAGALTQLGVTDSAQARTAAGRDGQCRLWWSHTPLDLYFAYDHLHVAMSRAVRRQPFADGSIPVLAPEHLLVCKVLFDRPKDWLDVEQMVVAVADLDVAEIEHWLERIIGSEDPRRSRLVELLR